MSEIPLYREQLPPGYNAAAVAFAVAVVHERGDLNHKLLACLLAIVRHVNDETGLANVGYERLMKLTGTSRRQTIADWLKKLREAGYIEKAEREGPNGSNVFKVPFLTYLSVYGGVGVAETGAHTRQRTTKEIEEERTLDSYRASASGENRDSDSRDWYQPIGRASAIEEAGEDAVALSERFTQTLIQHGRKPARYASDAYRPQWLQAFIALGHHVNSSVADDLRQADLPTPERDQLGAILRQEYDARFDAVFGFIATYEGDDPEFKHLDYAQEITNSVFDEVLKLCEFTGPLSELQGSHAPTKSVQPDDDAALQHGPGWARLQEVKARPAQRETGR
jgi:hypothetical protein